jgi:hypothetical protein
MIKSTGIRRRHRRFLLYLYQALSIIDTEQAALFVVLKKNALLTAAVQSHTW